MTVVELSIRAHVFTNQQGSSPSTILRSKNQIVKSVTDSSMIISDLRLISYMIIQDHTENRTQNRRLRNLTSIQTLSYV